MPANTARLGLRYPVAATDANNYPGDMQLLAQGLDPIVTAYLSGAAAGRPAAGIAGRIYFATDTVMLSFDTGSTWLTIWPKTLVIPHTFNMPGPIQIATGAVGYLPPFFVPVTTTQTATLVGMVTLLRSGNLLLNLNRNGQGVAGGIGVGATTTPNVIALNVALNNNDQIAPVVGSIANNPDGLTLTTLIAYTG